MIACNLRNLPEGGFWRCCSPARPHCGPMGEPRLRKLAKWRMFMLDGRSFSWTTMTKRIREHQPGVELYRGSGLRPCCRTWISCYFWPILGLERAERER